ncbi:hypothetical protein DFJ74DRAFT_649901 [Hyaloraphidium curvatum]|nr:hypothetical protein DFJ74DRAFT_649901 [Hyaloraphidium curvatum]
MRSMKEEAAPAGLAEEEEDESDDGEYQEGLAQVGLADAGEAASEPSEPDVQGGGDRGFEPGDAAAEEDDDDDDLLRDVEEEDLDGGIEDVDLPPEYADRFKKMQEMEKLDPVVSYEEGGGRRRRRTTASASAEDLPDAGGSDPISRVSSPKAAQPPKETTPAGGVASGSVSMSTTPPRMQTYDDLLFPSGQFSPHGGPAVHDGHLMQAPGSHLELPTAGMELDEFVVLGDDHDLHGHSGAGDGAWDELAD